MFVRDALVHVWYWKVGQYYDLVPSLVPPNVKSNVNQLVV